MSNHTITHNDCLWSFDTPCCFTLRVFGEQTPDGAEQLSRVSGPTPDDCVAELMRQGYSHHECGQAMKALRHEPLAFYSGADEYPLA